MKYVFSFVTVVASFRWISGNISDFSCVKLSLQEEEAKSAVYTLKDDLSRGYRNVLQLTSSLHYLSHNCWCIECTSSLVPLIYVERARQRERDTQWTTRVTSMKERERDKWWRREWRVRSDMSTQISHLIMMGRTFALKTNAFIAMKQIRAQRERERERSTRQ